MSYIGSQNFFSLTGPIENLATVLEPFHRPGINGTGFRDVGKRARVTDLESFVDVSTLGAVATVLANYKYMVGTFQPIESDLGTLYTNVMILGVQQVEGKAIGKSAGGLWTNPQAILRCTWQVQRT